MPIPFTLNPHEARVLGALMEKESTTPEYYPLSLNALQAACNQKSNREPVMALEEDEVRLALRNLQEKGLAAVVHDGRVPKFRHQLQEALNLPRGQAALVCVLLLRGPQTPGELRGRSERLFAFEDLEAVENTLFQMLERDPPLVAALPRQPGAREVRYAHLLAGPVAAEPEQPVHAASSAPTLAERVARLEADVADLRQRLESLSGQLTG